MANPILASSEQPIRASMLPKLFWCPAMFHALTQENGESNDLADTGSLFHAAASAFHVGKDGVKALRIATTEFPKGDADEAVKWFLKYKEWWPGYKVVAVEREVQIILDPAPFDKTKKAVVINGHLDLIVDDGEGPVIVDHKTGRTGGEKMVRDYAPQLAVYMLAGSGIVGAKVRGEIWRTRALMRKDLQFKWPMGFDSDGCAAILQTVVNRVAMLRLGRLDHTPSDRCDYCPLDHYPGCIDGKRRPLQIATVPTVKQVFVQKTAKELFK